MTAAADKKPAKPRGLGRRAAAYWRHVVDEYVLTPSETELLREACWLIHELDLLREVLAGEGAVIEGSKGQPRLNSVIGELRSHRLALGRLLAQLQLPDLDDENATGGLVTPFQSRSIAANTKRWGREPKGRPSRGA